MIKLKITNKKPHTETKGVKISRNIISHKTLRKILFASAATDQSTAGHPTSQPMETLLLSLLVFIVQLFSKHLSLRGTR